VTPSRFGCAYPLVIPASTSIPTSWSTRSGLLTTTDRYGTQPQRAFHFVMALTILLPSGQLSRQHVTIPGQGPVSIRLTEAAQKAQEGTDI